MREILQEVTDMPADERDLLIWRKLKEWGHEFPHPPDDLSVHMVVSKMWDCQGLLGNYFHALEEALCHAGNDQVDEESPSLYSMMHYRPGLFKVAALFTILHYERWRDSDAGERARQRIAERVAKRRASETQVDGQAVQQHEDRGVPDPLAQDP